MEHVIQKARLDSGEGRVKMGGRNIRNLRCADDTVLLAESSNNLKRLVGKVKEGSVKAGLQLNIKQIKIVSIEEIPYFDNEEIEVVRDFVYFDSTTNPNGKCSQESRRLRFEGQQ